MDTELKPCPFCGEEAGICEANDICFHRDDDGNKIFGGWRCFCPSCAIEQIGYETREEAVSAWNNRSTEHATHHAPVDEKGGDRMTGIERLRELVAGINPITVVFGVTMTAYDRKHKEVAGVRLRDFLSDIAGQIERELREERSRWDDELCDAQMDKTCVMAVYLEMNRHVLGHEGMEDSPVARWARELRAALGGDGRDPAADVSVSAYDPPSQEDRDAIAWVRDHGGLDAVKRRWECLSHYADPVPRSCMEKRLARLQRQIDESHAALRRRREIISELNRRACDLTRENAERGETIRKLSDRAAKQSDEIRVMRDVIAETCARLGVEGTGSTVDDAQVIWREISRRLMPDGMEWLLEAWPMFEDGEPVRFLDDFERYGDENGVSIVTMYQDGSFALNCRAYSKGERVNHPAPKVLDADGEEIRAKETVFDKNTGEELIVTGFEDGRVWCEHRMTDADALPVRGMWSPSLLTHERPFVDTWERLEEDAEKDPCGYFGFDGEETCGKCPASGKNFEQTMAQDLVRRCRALAERSE